jgi:D-amino peptidase
MEGISQLRHPYEIFACRPEYWDTGRARMQRDTDAAVAGLLEGGAGEVIILDNHASGNPVNVTTDHLPDSVRLETWNVFELPEHGIDAMLQVGYHARGGGTGFVSHTYGPGLRLRVDDELISESHGRAWASQAPLIGIVGNDSHRDTLGSLAETPYLVVQRTVRNDLAEPVFDADEGDDAIRAFARDAVRTTRALPAPSIPRDVAFAASLTNGHEQQQALEAAGWKRTGDVEYEARLANWSDARELIPAAMAAALVPLMPFWVGATSREQATALDPARVERISEIADQWTGRIHPDWYIAPDDELGLTAPPT